MISMQNSEPIFTYNFFLITFINFMVFFLFSDGFSDIAALCSEAWRQRCRGGNGFGDFYIFYGFGASADRIFVGSPS